MSPSPPATTTNGHARVILGLMTIGPRPDFGARITDPAEFARVLDRFQERGYDELDTARAYGHMEQEPFTRDHGRWRERRLRVATKVMFPFADGVHRADKVLESVHGSLEGLGTERVDIVYLHGPDRSTPFAETLEAIDKLHKEGKFEQFGLSNFTAAEVAEIVLTCKYNGWVRPTVYQAMYNAITRGIEPELVPVCRRFGLDVVIYNPIAGGLLSGKIKSKDIVPEAGRFSDASFLGKSYRDRYYKDSTFRALQTMERAVEKHAAEGLTLIEAALRWLTHHSALQPFPDRGGRDGVIIGISAYDQLDGNLDALEKGPLPEDVLQALDEAWMITKAETPNYWQKDLVYKYDTKEVLFGEGSK